VDDASGYTRRDLDRLALAEQAARLADRLHGLVGRHGHEVPAQEWLTGLIAPVLQEAQRLQALAVHYGQARGLDGPAIAQATGVEAEWGEPATIDDPDKLVAELEHWYIRHLWLDIAGGAVPDPVRRLLDGATPTPYPDCLICRKYAGGPIPAWAGWAQPPGGHLVDDDLWRVGHAPTVFSPRGALLLEARRHFLDYAGMTPEESASYAGLLGRLMPVIKEVTGAERVHVFSNMDGAPHFHTWLMPRGPQDVKGRRFLVQPGSCTEPEAADAIARMRALFQG
jgi:diadenosine tetraphosphate (Ap4A) HIT family hydrolase